MTAPDYIQPAWSRRDQAAFILECLRRRGIWVGLHKGEIDLTPPPGKKWQRRVKELFVSMRSLQWEVKAWLRWERREEYRSAIHRQATKFLQTMDKYFPVEDAP